MDDVHDAVDRLIAGQKHIGYPPVVSKKGRSKKKWCYLGAGSFLVTLALLLTIILPAVDPRYNVFNIYQKKELLPSLGPNFGNEAVSTSIQVAIENHYAGSVFESPSDIATIDYVDAYIIVQRTASYCKAAVYKVSDDSLVGVSAAVLASAETTAWYQFSFDPVLSVSPSTDYALVIGAEYIDDGEETYLCGESSGGWSYEEGFTYDSFPDPASPSEDVALYSIYAEYTTIPNVAPTQALHCVWDNKQSVNLTLNTTGGVAIAPYSFNVSISDQNGDKMNVTVRTNASGTWKTVNTSVGGTGLSNGVYVARNTSWVDSWSKKYWVSFNVTDSLLWKNTTKYFTTRPKPTVMVISPANGSTGVGTAPKISIQVNTSYIYQTDVYFLTNYTGSWVQHQRNNSIAQGNNQYNFTRYGSNPFSLPGYTGALYGVAHPNVLYFPDGEDGYKYWMYYEVVQSGTDSDVYLARSNDGVTWNATGVSNPIVGSLFGETHVPDPCCIKVGGKWFLYVHVGNHGSANNITVLTSSDGKTFSLGDYHECMKSNKTWKEHEVASSEVVYKDGIFHMWYDGVSAGDAYAIGYATSTDGYNWTDYVSNPVFQPTASAWDSDEVWHMSVAWYNNSYLMYYIGDNNAASSNYSIGVARSYNGIQWTKYSNNPMLSKTGSGWESVRLHKPCVLHNKTGEVSVLNGKLTLYYVGQGPTLTSKYNIGVAYSNSTMNTSGIVRWVFDEATTAGKKYWWKVNITQKSDGSPNATSWYCFTTAGGATSWKTVQTLSGVVLNTTRWWTKQTVTGVVINSTIWRTKQTLTGLITNTTLWRTKQTITGNIVNTTRWWTKQTLTGVILNTTRWRTSQTIVGSLTNTTKWKTIITLSGVIQNTTRWWTKQTITGVILNTTAWRTMQTITGLIQNTTTWRTKQMITGSILNSTRWWTKQTLTGSILNTTRWWTTQTITGIVHNDSINLWKTAQTITGMILNTTTWRSSQMISGLLTNTTRWHTSLTLSGVILNTTRWWTKQTIVGSIHNDSVENWKTIQTVSGEVLNTTKWQTKQTITGMLNSYQTWRASQTISGLVQNTTRWVTKQTITGIVLNMTRWRTTQTLNGVILNVSITGWQTTQTLSGVVRNLSGWRTVETLAGLIRNTSIVFGDILILSVSPNNTVVPVNTIILRVMMEQTMGSPVNLRWSYNHSGTWVVLDNLTGVTNGTYGYYTSSFFPFINHSYQWRILANSTGCANVTRNMSFTTSMSASGGLGSVDATGKIGIIGFLGLIGIIGFLFARRKRMNDNNNK